MAEREHRAVFRAHLGDIRDAYDAGVRGEAYVRSPENQPAQLFFVLLCRGRCCRPATVRSDIGGGGHTRPYGKL